MRHATSIPGAALLAAALAGCTVESRSPSPPVVVVPAAGELTVTWTVAGASTSSECAFYAADALEIVVFDRAGRVVADELGNCEDFAITLELPVDMYDADVTLVDVHDIAVSTTLPLDDLRVTDGTELVVDIDFPAGSML